MNKEINLRDLFTLPKDKLPEWVLSTFNCIYFIKPIFDTHSNGYIGQTTNLYNRFVENPMWSHLNNVKRYRTGDYLCNAIRKHKSRNYIVIILEENLTKDILNSKESYYIELYDTYVNGYNKNTGGDGREHLRNKLLQLYPETNGVPPEAAAANKRYYPEYNGITRKCIDAGHAAQKIYWPETNGLPPRVREVLLEKYPETNGVPPQNIKKWNEAGLKAIKEKYPETNGVSPQTLEAAHKKCKELWPEFNGGCPYGIKALKEKYPDTNGVPPQNTVKWRTAGSNANKIKYPEHNGITKKCLEAGTKAAQYKHNINTYNSYLEISKICNSRDITKLTKQLYYSFKLPMTNWTGWQIRKVFKWFDDNNLDTSSFKSLFPDKWTKY